jgi:D-arginine dehydrogenase
MMADILIIGGGIGGLSVAAELSADAKVVVIEAETALGYHASGRSGATIGKSYGNALIRSLTAKSFSFFSAPPDGFADVELIKARPWLILANHEQSAALERWQEANSALIPLSEQEVRTHIPFLKPDYAAGGALDTGCADVDVDALLQGYARQIRRNGGSVLTGLAVQEGQYADGCWQVSAGDQTFSAPIVINAAGGWADQMGERFGLPRLGLQPLRRTAILVEVPPETELKTLPVVIDAEEQFYFKPEAGKLMVSPADETPQEPSDAYAEEIDIAIAADRFEQATTIAVKRVSHSWAGLRTFAPDRSPVAGFDPRVKGFCWLAGQGGYGIQIAPALAKLTAAIIRGDQSDAMTQELSPARLLNGV